tara:strand:- start:3417 stop:3668 length:252 start_codon:yes stop_codon:yes gene_type:complete
MNPDTISCELHDFIEVVCMYGYQLKLILKNGRIIEGKAIDIITATEQREYLVIDNGAQQQIELTQLAKIRVITPNAKFNEIIF